MGVPLLYSSPISPLQVYLHERVRKKIVYYLYKKISEEPANTELMGYLNAEFSFNNLNPLIGQFLSRRKLLLKKDLTQRIMKLDQVKLSRNKVLLSTGGYYLIIFDWGFAIHSIFKPK
jgi:hypothetical protein